MADLPTDLAGLPIGLDATTGPLTVGDCHIALWDAHPSWEMRNGGSVIMFMPHPYRTVYLGGREDDAPVIVDLDTGDVTIRDEARLSEAARAFWQMVRALHGCAK